mgnify:FL=1
MIKNRKNECKNQLIELSKRHDLDYIARYEIPEVLHDDFDEYIVGKTIYDMDDIIHYAGNDVKVWIEELNFGKGFAYPIQWKAD